MRRNDGVCCLAVTITLDSRALPWTGSRMRRNDDACPGLDPVSLTSGARPDASAPGRVCGQRGESPLQAYALRPVTNCNCVAARRGGKQQEVTDQSVGDERDSAVSFGEPASDW